VGELGEERPSEHAFPAQCDGPPVAAGADLQRSVASMEPEATVCVGPGTFEITAPIRLRDGMHLLGAGRDKTFITTDSSEVILDASGTAGVRLEALDVSGAVGSHGCRPGCGRGIVPGLRTVITNVRSHDNENNGIGGQDGGLFVSNVELDHNGSGEFLGCCASGIKSGQAFTIRDSFVHDNTGVGIWCDVGCGNGSLEIVGNSVAGNSLGGIRYEISSSPALIAGNRVINNNSVGKGGHGGIEINSSQNVTVVDNHLGGNGDWGIIISGNRSPGIADVAIRNNVLNGDQIRGCGETVVCAGNS